MALKKVKRPVINKNQKEENKVQNALNNTVNNEMVKKVENSMKEILEEGASNQGYDEFFNNDGEVIGETTPLEGLEIELQTETAIAESRYKFRVQNLDIARQVETRYGTKDKLIIEFHIWQVMDGQEVAYDLKQKYNISASYKSEFYKVYNDLTGNPPRGKIDLRKLLGIKGICEIKHIQMDNGDIFPKVVNINAEIKI